MSEYLNNLPVFPHLDEILQAVQSSRFTILTATPGSGKTLLVAPHLVQNSSLRIAMLQPRRVAAQMSTHSIARFNSWSVGREVGLVMRHVHKRSRDTRLTVMTEGVLSRMLASGDAARQFDLIILDEFHERSIHTDLACAWARKQKDIKLLVMSATLDVQPLLDFFEDASVFRIEGRIYPVQNHYLKRTVNYHNRQEFDHRFLEICQSALSSHREGNVLAFLPGSGEIERLKDRLETEGVARAHGLEVHGLYSRAKKDQQQRALADDQKRKLILSTNIAETSLTIPNVKVVIDSGLQKETSYNPRTGVETLALRRVALDSAIQREGRAGRLQSGVCFKLWTRADEQRFRPAMPAEIHRMDPIELILQVMSFGETLQTLPLLETPEADQLRLAHQRLLTAGCIQQDRLTPLGQWVAQFPADFSSALLAAVSQGQNFYGQALLTVVILQEGDPAPFLKQARGETKDDLRSRLAWLEDNPQHRYHQLALKLGQQAQSIPVKLDSVPPVQTLEEALVFAFPHRLCRFRPGKKQRAIMSTGRGVKVEKGRTGKNAEFFIALQLMDHQLHGQSESEALFLCDIAKKSIKSVFDSAIREVTTIEKTSKKDRPQAFVVQSFWDLPLEDPRGAPLQKKHVIEHWKSQFFEQERMALKDYPESLSFVERVLFCGLHETTMDWPSFSTEDWGLVVEVVFADKKDLEVTDQEWLRGLRLMLTEAQLDFMESFAPHTFANRIRKANPISYSDPKKPVVSMILQEAFEFKESPTIGNGQVVLAIELLAPSRRPIEVSQDMARFWQFSYPEVRKQYRGRYPKHAWPEPDEIY